MQADDNCQKDRTFSFYIEIIFIQYILIIFFLLPNSLQILPTQLHAHMLIMHSLLLASTHVLQFPSPVSEDPHLPSSSLLAT